MSDTQKKDASAELASKREELAATEAALVEAEQGMNADGVVTLSQKCEVLRRFVAVLENDVRAEAEGKGKEEATARLVGIRRAYGSALASIEADEERVKAAVSAVDHAVTRLNDRHAQLARLRAEASALADRFGIPTPALAMVIPPARKGLSTECQVPLAGHVREKVDIERCEHGLRERRTYAEVRGTEGHEIIERVGRKAFPELTAAQRKRLDEAKEQKARENREAQSLVGLVQGVGFASRFRGPATV